VNGLTEFGDFVLHTEGKELSELENIIITGIISFSKAISNPDLHQRIVEIFSIFEFLLLKDEDQPIIESVTRYCSKLTSKSVEERKEIISLLKELYKVRSGMIHHAKRKKINNNKLTLFQVTLLVLLRKLINKSKTHKTKLSLIDEIDLEILKAY
jgi:Apea-like HEPN